MDDNIKNTRMQRTPDAIAQAIIVVFKLYRSLDRLKIGNNILFNPPNKIIDAKVAIVVASPVGCENLTLGITVNSRTAIIR